MTAPPFSAGEIREQRIRGLTQQLRTARRRAQLSPHALEGARLRGCVAQLERKLRERCKP